MTSGGDLEWPVARVRQSFVDYFKTKEHTFVPSSAVIPHEDPTLLFINAGMNQFKALFLGTADPHTEFGQLKRAANSQMCIRAGGKHNDLDDVGRDTYHHTFFEMLGNWSFGDYFKEDAIAWAWELLTKVYGMPADRLYVTYFEGDPKNGLEPDLEAKRLWGQFLPEDHIIPGNAKDNFWEMGDTGPCGPCSELHFDRIGGRNAASLVNQDDPMVIEIWNLVFMQFERRGDSSLTRLPNSHVDTGMGLERIVSILQHVHSNYDSDAWTPIFAVIQTATGYSRSYAEVRDDAAGGEDATVAYRVIADHIRCLTCALADDAMPDSVGRGFVLRRIIRRAVRYGVQFMGAKTGFFSELVDSVVASLGPFFTHLQDPKTVQRIKLVLANEEESFAKTWDNGLKHFNTAVEDAKGRTSTVISGADAYVLHDRYGFPVDLTMLLAEKAAMSVDVDAFNAEMKVNQVSAGRVAAAKTFLDAHQLEDLKTRGVPQTQDAPKYTWENATANVVGIFDKKAVKFIDVLAPSSDKSGAEDYCLILDATNFYAESGGQIFDTGRIVTAADAVFDVKKVFSYAGYTVHVGNLSKDSTAAVPLSANVELQVNYDRRKPIAANHTATHELNWVLRKVLEEDKPDAFMRVQQKGSLVTDDLLRFDFSYNTKVAGEDLAKIEGLLNEKIKKGLPVYRKEVSLEAATKINGLRHMFGEKYPDPVSVCSVGAPVEDMVADPANEKWRGFAVEFCGGTHLSNLADAQQAVILSEEALMNGVRRITVVTRGEATKAVAIGAPLTAELAALAAEPVSAATVKALSVLNKKVGDSAAPLLLKNQLREDIDVAIRAQNAQLKVLAAEATARATVAGKAAGESHDAAASPFAALEAVDCGADREELQGFTDGFLAAVAGPVGLFLIGRDGDKALALVSMPKEFVAKKLSAVSWAKAVVGKGGGKPNSAQSGLAAKDIPEVIKKAQAEAETMKAAL